MTAALGLAVGAGHLWLPITCAATAWIVFYVPGNLERRNKSVRLRFNEGHRPGIVQRSCA